MIALFHEVIKGTRHSRWDCTRPSRINNACRWEDVTNFGTTSIIFFVLMQFKITRAVRVSCDDLRLGWGNVGRPVWQPLVSVLLLVLHFYNVKSCWLGHGSAHFKTNTITVKLLELFGLRIFSTVKGQFCICTGKWLSLLHFFIFLKYFAHDCSIFKS